MHRTALHASLTLTVLGLCTALTPAGAQQKSDAEVREEVEFARGLASDWGFVDMALRVVSDSEAAGVSPRMADELALTKCELYFTSARRNSARRDELLAQALAAYKEFVERRQFSELLPIAEAQLVSVSGYYAKSLAQRLESSAGEEAEKVRGELQSVLEGAIAQSNKLISGVRAISRDERTEADNARLYELLLNLGDMYLELGKTQDEPTFSFGQSFAAYEDLVSEATETSPAALRAFVGLGDNLVAQGKFEEAAGFYDFVVEMAITRDPVNWKETRDGMSPEELEKRFRMVQLATEGLVSANAQAGLYDAAVNGGLHFFNTWKREGLDLQQPAGYLSLLAVARALMDSGGYVGGNWSAGEGQWFPTFEEMTARFSNRREQKSALEVALAMAQIVNADNKGNTLQIRAQKVISEVISRPGVTVDPEILFEAAQGEYFARDYVAAAESFKSVLGVLERAEASKRTEIGPKLLWHLGRCYQNQDRLLEAAMTFQTALDRFSGDPEFDSRNATSFYDTMRAVQRGARGDTIIDGLYRRSEDLVARFNESKQGDIVFRNAEKAYGSEEYENARALYQQVPIDAEGYEKALVFSGVCAYKLGDLASAEKAFDQYLNGFLKDPKNQTTDPRKKATRQGAEASALFYWGLSAYKRANDGTGDWAQVIELLTGYEDRFPDQQTFSPAAMFATLVAFDRTGQRPKVRALYEKMIRLYPNSQRTGGAAAEYYRSLKTSYDAEQDPAKQRELLFEMAENLQVLNRTAATPSYTNMKTEATHWIDLEEWATAEALIEKILARFTEGEDGADATSKLVPKLGKAYLMLRKPQKAAEVLAESVEGKTSTRESAQIYARALAGWAHYEPDGQGGGAVQVEAGLGGAENFEKATEILKQLDSVAEAWTTDWYAYKFDLLYAYLAWSKLDSKKLEVVKSQLGFLSNEANLGRQFHHEHMPEDLRQQYLWLQNEAR